MFVYISKYTPQELGRAFNLKVSSKLPNLSRCDDLLMMMMMMGLTREIYNYGTYSLSFGYICIPKVCVFFRPESQRFENLYVFIVCTSMYFM